MRPALIPILIMPLLVGACAGGANDQPMEGALPDASLLLETDRAFAQYSADSGAVAAFSMYLAENAVQMPSGAAPINGRDSIVAAMDDGPDFKLLWEPQYAEIARSGELGWTWGIYEAHFPTGEGEEVTSAGKYLNVWRKQEDGTWKVVVDMGNSGV